MIPPTAIGANQSPYPAVDQDPHSSGPSGSAGSSASGSGGTSGGTPAGSGLAPGTAPYPAWAQNPNAATPPERPAASSPYTGPPVPYTGHSWHLPWGGAPVVISGGTISVSTEDLDSLASDLDSAATSFDNARTTMLRVRRDVESAPMPVSNMSTAPLSLQPRSGVPDPAPSPSGYECVAGPAPLPLSMGQPSQWLTPTVDPLLIPLRDARYHAERSAALSAIDALTNGPGSLQDAAETLRGIASDVRACSEMHTLAEGGAVPNTSAMGPVDIKAFDQGLVNEVLGVVSVVGINLFDLLTTPGSDAYRALAGSEGGQAAIEALTVLQKDKATDSWVRADAARLVLLALWLKNAKTGREAATVGAYIQQVSRRLDPWVTGRMPAQVQMGSQTVDTTSLTPVQRVTKYLAQLSGDEGASVYGTPLGLTVTPLGGKGATKLPPSTSDPLGLRTSVLTGLTGPGAASRSPQNISETVSHGAAVQRSKSALGQEHEEAGVISIQQVQHADGRVSWMVYVPGTTDWTSGDGEPQDLLTNLEAVGRTPTVMESAVVTAMRQAGIQPGEDVALYGHSQGGITVSNLAADPAVRERYSITTVLTAGAPTAGADIPDDVHALHLENTGDAVPGLDGTPTPVGPHRQVATIDTHQQDMSDYPHSSNVYAKATEGLEGRAPEISDWSQSFARASGAGEAGVTTREYTFAVQRDTAPDGIYRDGPDIPPYKSPRPHLAPVG